MERSDRTRDASRSLFADRIQSSLRYLPFPTFPDDASSGVKKNVPRCTHGPFYNNGKAPASSLTSRSRSHKKIEAIDGASFGAARESSQKHARPLFSEAETRGDRRRRVRFRNETGDPFAIMLTINVRGVFESRGELSR